MRNAQLRCASAIASPRSLSPSRRGGPSVARRSPHRSLVSSVPAGHGYPRPPQTRLNRFFCCPPTPRPPRHHTLARVTSGMNKWDWHTRAPPAHSVEAGPNNHRHQRREGVRVRCARKGWGWTEARLWREARGEHRACRNLRRREEANTQKSTRKRGKRVGDNVKKCERGAGGGGRAREYASGAGRAQDDDVSGSAGGERGVARKARRPCLYCY